jgi:prevent-host-death family protein
MDSRVGVVNARDLARDTSKLLEEVEEGRAFLVTRHGVPVATVTPINQEALEDFVLAQAPEFVEGMAAADAELAAGETVSLAVFMEKLQANS